MDKPKILIVDDDPDLRRGLNLRLRANHFETAYATDGFSAIAMAQKERPDLIILDIGLPAGDGFVVLDRLQQSAHAGVYPSHRLDRARSPVQPGTNFEGRGMRFPAEARRQQRIDGRDSHHPKSGLAGYGGCGSARPLGGKLAPLSTKIPARLFPGGYSLRRACGYAAFFNCLTLAQRALCAAAIFRRAATESRLRLGLV